MKCTQVAEIKSSVLLFMTSYTWSKIDEKITVLNDKKFGAYN